MGRNLSIPMPISAVPHRFGRRNAMPRFIRQLAWFVAVIVGIISAASAAWAQGSWTKLAPFPEPAEEIDGASFASCRLHYLPRQDLRLRRLRASGIRAAGLGTDQ